MTYVWQRACWPNLSWQSETLAQPLGRTRLRQGQLINKIEALGLDLTEEARAAVLSEEALKTAAIEGESLNPEAIRSSVARHLGLPTAGLPVPDRQVDGLVDVLLDATVHYDKSLSAQRLKGWQAALFPTGYSGLHRIRVGQWRGPTPMRVVSGPIGREKIHFEAPPHDRVATDMRRFLTWWKQSQGKIEGFIRAGIAHFYFVTIHPFEDGNGRVARALTDMALAQDEQQSQRFYSLSSQIMTERKTYYDVLEQSQHGDGDITEWLSWFLACCERAMKNSESLIETVLLKAKFWQEHAQTPLNKRQRKVLNKLLAVGPSGFEGGLSTRKYVSIARVSRATAYREIRDLCNKGILQPNEPKGRSVSYSLRWPSM